MLQGPGSVSEIRRKLWLSMLLYPGHTLPTAAAPVLVACGLAVREGVFHCGRHWQHLLRVGWSSWEA
ncbi:MAG: hypothetical protein HY645_09080 [Acidobacteria bacterium]|nr:hypothetical protein [Acidobacteriota bacterium]